MKYAFFVCATLHIYSLNAVVRKIDSAHPKFQIIKRELQLLHAPTSNVPQLNKQLEIVDLTPLANKFFIASLNLQQGPIYYVFNSNADVEHLIEKLKRHRTGLGISWYYLDDKKNYRCIPVTGGSKLVRVFKLPDYEYDKICEKQFDDVLMKAKY